MAPRSGQESQTARSLPGRPLEREKVENIHVSGLYSCLVIIKGSLHVGLEGPLL